MKLATNLFIGLVALLHIGFLVMQMFLWTTPIVLDIFHLSLEHARIMSPLAANQGLYNGFLAAGLLWGLQQDSSAIKSFFLVCIVTAGIYGAVTVQVSILFVQALPAAIALLLLWWQRDASELKV